MKQEDIDKRVIGWDKFKESFLNYITTAFSIIKGNMLDRIIFIKDSSDKIAYIEYYQCGDGI